MWAVLILILIVLMAMFLTWAFSITFVRSRKAGDVIDMEGQLKPFEKKIREGIRFIKTRDHVRVYTESYDGLRLAASYYSGGFKRTILIFHGYRSCGMRDYSCAVQMYLDMGLNVLMVDQRSHGESEGRLITFGVKERRDVLTWVEYILKNHGEDMQLFLGGLSMGASTVMMAASLPLPANVKGIVADCGFTSPAAIIGRIAKQNYHMPANIIAGVLNVLCHMIGGFSLYECSTPRILADSDIPILLIHGKGDDFVPCEMSIESYHAAKGDKKLCLVEEAGHGLSYLFDPKGVSEALKSFFDTYGPLGIQ